MFLLAAFVIFMSMKESEYFSGAKYDIRVVNGFTDNSSLALVIWCSSGDENLGGRALQVGDDYSWSVETSIWGTTLSRCTMKWDAIRKQFDAFHGRRDVWRCGPLRTCFWLVREDGFYFSNDQVNWKKVFSWDV